MFRIIILILSFVFLHKSEAQDLGVISSSLPVSGCMLSSSEVVQVFVFNFGPNVSTPFDISYSINGGVAVTETVNLGTFLSSSSYTHTFTIPADLSSPNIYSLCYYTSVAGESNNSNDTLCTSIVCDALTIGGNPQTSALVCSGSNAGTLNLSGNLGDVLDWQSSETGGVSWNNIGNTTLAQGYNNLILETWYRVIVKNGFCPADTSIIAQITLDQPSIGGTLTGPDTVCEPPNSGTITLSGEFGLIDSWEYSEDGGSNWTSVNNTTSSEIFTDITNTRLYRSLALNGVCSIAYSDTLTVTVIPGATGGTLSSLSGSVCLGQNSQLIQLSGYSGIIDSWESSPDGTTWTNILNGGSDSYTTSNLTIDTWYRVIVDGCLFDTSTSLTLTIDPLSISGILTGDTTVCYGQNNGNITLSGENGLIIDWINSIDGGLNWFSLGQTSSPYNFTNLTDSTIYKAIVQSGTCPTDTSNVVYVNVASGMFGTSSDTTISEGETVMLNAFGGANYSWTPVESLDNPLSQNVQASPLSTTIYIVEITDTNTCIYIDSVIVTIISNAEEMEISNLITANSDGYNDYWVLKGYDQFLNIKVSIINKNGVVVYVSDNYQNNWDGKYQGNYLPSGTYFYIIEHPDLALIKGHLNIVAND